MIIAYKRLCCQRKEGRTIRVAKKNKIFIKYLTFGCDERIIYNEIEYGLNCFKQKKGQFEW